MITWYIENNKNKDKKKTERRWDTVGLNEYKFLAFATALLSELTCLEPTGNEYDGCFISVLADSREPSQEPKGVSRNTKALILM